MSRANSKTRRAEPRTAADLAKRGYKVLSIGRPTNWGGRVKDRRGQPARLPMQYKLVYIGADARSNQYDRNSADQQWFGLIKGPAHKAQAYRMLSGTGIAKRPLKGGPYESIVAAAHALLDEAGL